MLSAIILNPLRIPLRVFVPRRQRLRVWFQRLKLQYHTLLSRFAFNVCFQFQLAPLHLGGNYGDSFHDVDKVGLCRLNA
jgi:hypothetical protein